MSHSKQNPKQKPLAKSIWKRPWVLLLALGGLLILVIAALSSATTNAESSRANKATLDTAVSVHGKPQLQVDHERIDLGNVKLGQFVKAIFKLSNVGDRPLRFTASPYITVVEGC